MEVFDWIRNANIQDSISNPHMLHAIAVHLPIALVFIAIPLVYICAVASAERDILRWVTVGLYAVVAIAAYLAQLAGSAAYHDLGPDLPGSVWAMADTHEAMGEKTWMFAVVTMFLLALSSVKVSWFRTATMTLAMIASLVTGAWVAVTGHYGGALVYQHGAGVVVSASPEMPDFRRGARSRHDGWEGRERHNGTSGGEQRDGEHDGEADESVAQPIAVRPIDAIEASRVSYVNEIKPLFEQKCVSCHRPGKMRGDFDITTVPAMLKGGEESGPSIMKGRPDESPMVKYVRGELKPRMPNGRDPLSEDQLHKIREWISAGAVDDSGGAIGVPAPPAVTTPVSPPADAPAAPPTPPSPAPPTTPAPPPAEVPATPVTPPPPATPASPATPPATPPPAVPAPAPETNTPAPPSPAPEASKPATPAPDAKPAPEAPSPTPPPAPAPPTEKAPTPPASYRGGSVLTTTLSPTRVFV